MLFSSSLQNLFKYLQSHLKHRDIFKYVLGRQN
jgi:hypothetical protein